MDKNILLDRLSWTKVFVAVSVQAVHFNFLPSSCIVGDVNLHFFSVFWLYHRLDMLSGPLNPRDLVETRFLKQVQWA